MPRCPPHGAGRGAVGDRGELRVAVSMLMVPVTYTVVPAGLMATDVAWAMLPVPW